MNPGSTSRDRWMVAGAAAAAMAAGFVAYSPAPVGVFWDDAVYVITAKALATGEGYRFIHLPGEPAATHYPPLWPAILSIIWKIAPDFPENVRFMKLLNPLFLAAGAAGATVLGVRVARIPFWMSAIVAALTVIVAPILLLSAVLMSEPLALALSAFALASASLMVVRGRTRDAVLAGALVGLAVLARSAAVVLLPGLAVGLLWRRSRRASAISLAISLVLIVPWLMWSSAHAGELPPALAGAYGPYGAWLVNGYRADPSLIGEVISNNVVHSFQEVGVLAFGAFPRFTRPTLLALLFAFVFAGLAIGRRRMAPLAVSLAAYVALVLVWPYAPGRFVWAYAPLFAMLVAAAVSALVRRARVMRAWRVPTALAAAVVAAAFISIVRYDLRGFQQGWHRLAIEPLADGVTAPVKWIADRTATTDIIASDLHLQAYLYAGRIGTPISSLTVAEYIRPKPDSLFMREYAAIDSTFRPNWWIASAMTNERATIHQWVSRPGQRPLFALGFPSNGLAVRVRGQ